MLIGFVFYFCISAISKTRVSWLPRLCHNLWFYAQIRVYNLRMHHLFYALLANGDRQTRLPYFGHTPMRHADNSTIEYR